MSKSWYPVINMEKCIECGACIIKCTHGVYKQKTMTPVVVNPDYCITGCRGCARKCPVDAIEYFGDKEECCSEVGCGCHEETKCGCQ